jgi:hypothetical protein
MARQVASFPKKATLNPCGEQSGTGIAIFLMKGQGVHEAYASKERLRQVFVFSGEELLPGY